MAAEATCGKRPYAEPVTNVSPTSTVADEPNPYRLDRRAVPSHYAITIRPDVAAGTFTGSVVIDLDVAGTTDELVCNAADLIIDEAWVTDAAGARQDLTVSFDADAERVTFTPVSALDAGAVRLHARFTGSLLGRLAGIYLSHWIDAEGTDHPLVVTQLQATDARRAFPCWDEPSFKATFALTLVVPGEHLAVANTAEVDRRPADGDPGRDVVIFAPTMVMSTYLVAFAVGPFEATAPVDASGVPVRVIHPPGKGHLADYALEVATFCLDWFAEYYGIPYPGDKLDLLAIPDFAFGAMENLGCVTFREVLLLVDPAEATQPEMQAVTDVIAHELAHM
jgi:puromycin-sensitive aminopeptidase